jgi:phospholipid-transporting ATPase
MQFSFGRTIYHLAKSPTYWLTIFLTIVIGLLPHFLFKLVHHHFWPSDIQIAREAEILRRGPDYWVSKPVGGSSRDVNYVVEIHT